MTGEFYVDEKSLKNLRINMKVFKAELLRSAVRGLQSFGMEIVRKAQDLLKANGSVVTGLLRGSGRTVVQPDNTVDAGFYAGYAYWVEYGRKSGGMPPVDVIYEWVRKKNAGKRSALKSAAVFSGKSQDELARSAAWAIAKSIKEKGTKPHPFLKPAYDQYRTQIAQYMQIKVNQTCDKFKAK